MGKDSTWICCNDIVPSKHVRQNVTSLLTEKLREKYESAIKQAKFLLEVKLSGTPATYNHYFNDNLNKWYVRPWATIETKLKIKVGKNAYSDSSLKKSLEIMGNLST